MYQATAKSDEAAEKRRCVRQNHVRSCKLRLVRKPVFTSLPQIFAFYRNHNPARQKAVNLLEPEGSDSFDRETEEALFSFIVKIIYDRKKGWTFEQWQVVWWYWLAPQEHRLNMYDICDLLKKVGKPISRSTGYRVKERAEDDLQRMFEWHGFLEEQEQISKA